MNRTLMGNFMRALGLKRRETDNVKLHVIGHCLVCRYFYDMSPDSPVEQAVKDLMFYKEKGECCGAGGTCSGSRLHLFLGLPK